MEPEPYTTKEMVTQLQSLRPILLTEHGRGFLDLFDEFMREQEFESALHIVCDYILEPNSSAVSNSTIEQIRRLHTAMEIADSCVEKLQNSKSA
jgi:hypothetical protein